jgi:ferredoxin
MRIVPARGTCEGLGMCEAMAPDFFEVAEDGFVRVLADPAEEHRGDLTAATDACPVLALRLEG